MPLLPKVPHIVGDDDELNETDQRINGTANIASDSEAGCSSLEASSSYDDDSDDEASSESIMEEEEEGEDWSNNISYVMRTPERVPLNQESVLVPTEPEDIPQPVVEVELGFAEDMIDKNDQPIDLNENKHVESDQSDLTEYNTDYDEEDLPNAENLSKLISLKKTVQRVLFDQDTAVVASTEPEVEQPFNLTENKHVESNEPDLTEDYLEYKKQNLLDSDVEMVPNEPVNYNKSGSTVDANEMLQPSAPIPPKDNSEKENIEIAKTDAKIPEEDPTIQEIVTTIEPLEEPRRLRSANRANQTITKEPRIGNVRKRKRPVKSEKINPTENTKTESQKTEIQKTKSPTSPSKTIGARVAKRSRDDVKLAKPVDVTEYFSQISAKLVSHRINLQSFLEMRTRIDILIEEAIAPTKSN